MASRDAPELAHQPLICSNESGAFAFQPVSRPIPPLATQQTFVSLQAELTSLKCKHSGMREANAALLPATLERIFQSEATT